MTVEKLERTLSDVASDLAQEPKASEQPGKVKKVAKESKKAAKKVGKKANGKAEAAPKKAAKADNMVTLADLAAEASITGAAARRRLRSAGLSPEGRWKWDDGSKALKEARKALGLDE